MATAAARKILVPGGESRNPLAEDSQLEVWSLISNEEGKRSGCTIACQNIVKDRSNTIGLIPLLRSANNAKKQLLYLKYMYCVVIHACTKV
jgi:hypothetical protein